MTAEQSYSYDAERAIISRLLCNIDTDKTNKTLDFLCADDFYLKAHKLIVSAMNDLRKADKHIGPCSVFWALSDADLIVDFTLECLRDLIVESPRTVSSSFARCCDIVKVNSISRKINKIPTKEFPSSELEEFNEHLKKLEVAIDAFIN